MPRQKAPAIGSVNWFDLTVKDAAKVRDFYAKVVGWKSSGFDMGGYEDFCMHAPANGKTVAGICHARGKNAKLPPQWLIYITVKNLTSSLKQCRALGGKVLVQPHAAGAGRIAVIQDPAGAVAALFQPG
jgi:predicted enzyme related to lactoylglutathione lyase